MRERTVEVAPHASATGASRHAKGEQRGAGLDDSKNASGRPYNGCQGNEGLKRKLHMCVSKPALQGTGLP